VLITRQGRSVEVVVVAVVLLVVVILVVLNLLSDANIIKSSPV
jgi:hypothetical protein